MSKFEQPSIPEEQLLKPEEKKTEDLQEKSIEEEKLTEREFLFFDKNLNPETPPRNQTEKDEQEKAIRILSETRRRQIPSKIEATGESRISFEFEGEVEKTQDETTFIFRMNDWLEKELAELKLDEKTTLHPQNFHLLPARVFEGKYPDSPCAVGVTRRDGIAVKIERPDSKDWDEKLSRFSLMLHEAVHFGSYRKLYFAPKQEKFGDYRSGYAMRDPHKQNHIEFNGLNEAVVDKIAIELFMKHKEEIAREFNIPIKQITELNLMHYYTSISFLDHIIQRVAENKKTDTSSVWEKFKKGLFTGEMMPLRDVEKTFGKNALRVLSALPSKKEDFTDEVYERFYRFFCGKNKEEKNIAEKQILAEINNSETSFEKKDFKSTAESIPQKEKSEKEII